MLLAFLKLVRIDEPVLEMQSLALRARNQLLCSLQCIDRCQCVEHD